MHPCRRRFLVEVLDDHPFNFLARLRGTLDWMQNRKLPNFTCFLEHLVRCGNQRTIPRHSYRTLLDRRLG